VGIAGEDAKRDPSTTVHTVVLVREQTKVLRCTEVDVDYVSWSKSPKFQRHFLLWLVLLIF